MRRTIFSEEHDMFRESFRKWAEREVVPNQKAWGEAGIVEREAWRKAGAAGFLCTAMKEEEGGPGGDFLHSAIVIEEP